MGEERRKSARLKLDVPVRLHIKGATINGRIRDLCRDAALVEADTWYPIGTDVELTIELPGAGPLEASGQVCRLAPGEQGTHDMAILFGGVSPGTAARLDFLVGLQG